MSYLKSLLFIFILLSSMFSFAKVDPADTLKSEDPNRQGLEEGPSAISLLTEVIGPNLGRYELVSQKNRDQAELFLKSGQKPDKATGSNKNRPSSTSE